MSGIVSYCAYCGEEIPRGTAHKCVDWRAECAAERAKVESLREALLLREKTINKFRLALWNARLNTVVPPEGQKIAAAALLHLDEIWPEWDAALSAPPAEGAKKGANQ